MDILLVSHGESQGNAEGRLQGTSDYPLTDRGRAQAARLSRFLIEHGLEWDRHYSSPLSRARETASILSAATGRPAPVLDARLVELDAGALTRLSFEEIHERFPSYARRKLMELNDYEEYGGESYGTVQLRAHAVRDTLEQRYRESKARVLLVGHGGFNFQLLKLLVCQPVPRVGSVKMGNCGVTLVRMSERRGSYHGEIVFHVPNELMRDPADVGGGRSPP
jgi:broad specificity phosphatase PhoE